MTDRLGDPTGLQGRDGKAGQEGRDPRGATMGGTAGSGGDEHIKCSCGQHCGCNPCTCAHSVVSTRVGKAYCKCGPGCTCATCAS